MRFYVSRFYILSMITFMLSWVVFLFFMLNADIFTIFICLLILFVSARYVFALMLSKIPLVILDDEGLWYRKVVSKKLNYLKYADIKSVGFKRIVSRSGPRKYIDIVIVNGDGVSIDITEMSGGHDSLLSELNGVVND